MRSLSFTGVQHRRATTLAVVVAMLPVVALELVAVVLVPMFYDRHLSAVRIAGLPLALLAVAVSVTPSRHVARALGLVAMWLASLGRWDANAASMALIIGADAVAGVLLLAPRRAQRTGSSSTRILTHISMRALGPAAFASLIPGLLLLGFAHLYRVNNQLSLEEARGALRGCALVGASMLFAALADRFIVRRPQWPWARSLPVGSRRRVLDDALLLAAAALPLVCLTSIEDWHAAAFLIGALPLLVIQAAGAIRRGTARMTSASGEVLLTGIVVTTVLTIWPVTVLLCIAMLPLSLAAAVRADRWLAGTAWSELHHSTAGDSLASAVQ